MKPFAQSEIFLVSIILESHQFFIRGSTGIFRLYLNGPFDCVVTDSYVIILSPTQDIYISSSGHIKRLYIFLLTYYGFSAIKTNTFRSTF